MTTLVIPSAFAPLLDAADASLGPVNAMDLAQDLRGALTDSTTLTNEERDGAKALLDALDFQRPFGPDGNPWGIYWGPISEVVDKFGTTQRWPDALTVSEDAIAYWIDRAMNLQNPDLRARFADLAWEIGCLLRDRRRKDSAAPAWTVSIPHTVAQRAVDSSVQAAELHIAEDFHGWQLVDRAIGLAITLGDKERIARGKKALFRFRDLLEKAGTRYRWEDFDEIAWKHRKALAMSPEEGREVIQNLQSALSENADLSNGDRFNPHAALEASDRLQRRWSGPADINKAQDALRIAGLAFEEIAKSAGGLVAMAWLEDLLPRYRNAGMSEDAVRVERAMRSRGEDAQGEMKRIEVSQDISKDKVEAWADQVAGSSLDDGLRRVAMAFLGKEAATKSTIENMVKDAPLLANMGISITHGDGVTAARVGSIEDDLEGRAIVHAADLFNSNASWLAYVFRRLQEKHGLNAENLLAFISASPSFHAERELLLREGLFAWAAEDFIKAIHVLVPQVEAALRNLHANIGGSIMRYSADAGGFEAVGMGNILHDALFVQRTPPDLRFHFKALYCDARGINLRNRLAHGLVGPGLLGRGVANWVVHSLLLIRMVKGTPHDQGTSAPD